MVYCKACRAELYRRKRTGRSIPEITDRKVHSGNNRPVNTFREYQTMKMKSGSADADRTERFGGSVLPLLLLKNRR